MSNRSRYIWLIVLTALAGLSTLLALMKGGWLGGLLVLVLAVTFLDRPWSDWRKLEFKSRKARFFEGLCLDCGYDLRSCSERCSECGREILRPEDPLKAPAQPSRFFRMAPESVDAAWASELRGPMLEEAWGDRARWRIAMIVAHACKRGAAWPNDHFRPGDAFLMMIDDPEGMGWFDVAMSIDKELHIDLQIPSERLLKMSFSEVVDEIRSKCAPGVLRRLGTNADVPAKA